MNALVRYAHTAIVRCGRSDPAFAKLFPEPDIRWCLLDANHKSIHIAGKGMSFEREVERYNEESKND